MIHITFYRKFEAAHRLIEGENLKTICAQPHGHTWRLRVHLTPLEEKQRLTPQENTFVLFAQVKKRWHSFIDNHLDHSFFFNKEDPLLPFMQEQLPSGRHVVVPGDPTSEMIAILCKAKCEAFLQDEKLPLKCTKLELNETETNGVLVQGDPKQYVPCTHDHWWGRPDNTTI